MNTGSRKAPVDPRVVADEAYAKLPQCWRGNDWLAETTELARKSLAEHRHGDLPRWLDAVDRMNPT